MKKLSIIVCVILGLNSCSRYLTNGDRYLQSRNGESLAIPSPLTSDNISHYYDLPQQTQDPRVSIAPPVVTKKVVKPTEG